jgi:TonB-linked SusC/RagA family outer membrane protein
MTMYIPQWLRKYKPLVLLITANLFFLAASAQVKISGKVTGKDGKGLTGVSVIIKNTNFGTATDLDGNYVLNTNLKPGKYDVQFSGVGFTTASYNLTIGSDNEYTVNRLMSEDALGLDEVVVTGTTQGTTKKQLGSYITSIKGDKLANAGTANALAALQGKVPGAQIVQNSGDPAGGMTVRLRGISTIGSASDPLYIVDGVMINNSNARVTNTQSDYGGSGAIGQNRMVDINPNDIERIEVLNGAAAAAIYGSRANAGVVQIFTKRGSTGAPQITFTTRFNTNSIRKRLVFNNAPVKFGGPTDGSTAFTQDIITLVGTPAALLTNTTPVTRYDYQDDIFRNGLGTDNNLSITGGKDKTKYYVSLNHNYNEGIIRKTSNQRYGFRVNLDQSLASWLTMNAGLNYTYNDTKELPDGNTFFSPINSMTIIGNFHNLKQRDVNGNLQAVGERGRVNPLSIFENIDQRNRTSRIISNVALKATVIKGLTIDYSAGLDNINQNGNTFIAPFTYNVSTGFYGGGTAIDPTQNGYASAANYSSLFFNHDLNVTFNTNLTEKLVSATQVGYSEQYEKGQYILAQSRGIGVGVRTVPGGATPLPANDSRFEQSIRGYFIQQNFKFNNQLFVTLAGRIDGSSVFKKENRNQFYPKASISYVLSETKAFEKLKFVNSFKIRAAYGESGNLTGIGSYDRFNTYNAGSFLGRTYLASSNTRSNDNIVPERQKEIEIGTDISLFNNRLQLTFNYYDKKVEDLIVPNLTIAPSTGFDRERKNVGSLTNKGFEILLSGYPVKTKDFSWEIITNYNKNKNRIENISAPLITFASGTGAQFALIPGYDAPVFYLTYFARDVQGNVLKNAQGIPVTERGNAAGVPQRDPATGLPYTSGPNSNVLRKALGSANPDYTATLINTFTYKKLSLRVQLDRVAGVEVFNADYRTRQGVGNGSELAEKEHKGELPRGYIQQTYAIEEWRLDDGSFTKLRELALTYNLGSLKKLFSNLSVTFAGRNLVSWDNYKGYDPETNATGQSTLLRGIDFGNVPIPRTFQMSITAKF